MTEPNKQGVDPDNPDEWKLAEGVDVTIALTSLHMAMGATTPEQIKAADEIITQMGDKLNTLQRDLHQMAATGLANPTPIRCTS